MIWKRADRRACIGPGREGRDRASTDAKGRSSFTFACPSCRTVLESQGPNERRCPVEGIVFRRKNGIWRFLLPERAEIFGQFIEEYEVVRRAEARGAEDPAYYRALPFEDRTRRYSDDWRIRAKSFEALLEQVVGPLEAARQRSLRALDLGAGNGWLSYRLAERGHRMGAVDLLTNAFDGLGAHVHYGVDFVPVQAEFVRLPFAGDQVDLAVFNASLHYSTDYVRTLRETLRVLREDGRLVIMDSPVYHNGTSGGRMVRERETRFEETYGFPSSGIPSENYLTYKRLEQLARTLDVRWQMIEPFYGWHWALKPLRAWVLGRREPARFVLIVGQHT